MERKNLMGIIFSVFFAATLIGTASSQEPVTTLSAPMVYDETLTPGSTFSIDIMISDVENLWGYQFILDFDPAILSALSYTSYAPFVMPFPSEINNTAGYVSVAFGMPFGTTEGFTGTTALINIEFSVEAYGGCYFNLHDSILTTPDVPPQLISHEIVDGHFANIAPQWSANLVRRSAWPEHHHWVVSKDSDLTLTAKVKNLGTMPTMVKAVFTVADGDGLWQIELETDVVLLKPNAMKNLAVTITLLDLNQTPPGPYGTYYIEAQCMYDSDGDAIIDAFGAKIKNTKFTAVA